MADTEKYYCDGQALRNYLEEMNVPVRKIGPKIGHGETYLYSFFAHNKMTNEIAEVLMTEYGIDVTTFCNKNKKGKVNVPVETSVIVKAENLEEKIYRAVLRVLKEVIG